MATETFTNETIDISTLPKYEEVVLKKPHADYWKIICINFFIFFGLIGIGTALAIYFSDDFRTNMTLIISSYLILTVSYFFILRVAYRKRGYAIRARDMIYKSGVIAESTTIVPLNRIQHIELNEGIFSRMYQLGALQIFTAGGHTGHLRISGIPIAEAKSIRDLLLHKLNLIENASIETEA